MVPQQILRRSRAALTGLAALSLLLIPGDAAAQRDRLAPEPETLGEAALLVDLSSDPAGVRQRQRAALIAALESDPRVRLVSRKPPAPAADSTPAWKPALELARTSLAELQCGKATAAARAALASLAVDHALGKPVRDQLAQAYAVWLRCEPGAADRVVARLRNLGFDTAPEGIDPKLWSGASPPPPSATEVRVSAPAGTAIWVDHRRAGDIDTKAALTLSLADGPHRFTAVAEGRGTSEVVEIGADRTVVELAVPPAPAPPPTDLVTTAEARWRAEGGPLRPSDVGGLLRERGVRVALILRSRGQVHIWALPRGTRFARRISGAPVSRPRYIAKLVNDWVQAEDGAGPDPAFPLLRESEEERKRREGGVSTQWWVYVAVGGAVTLASVLILTDQFAGDRQRIELTLP